MFKSINVLQPTALHESEIDREWSTVFPIKQISTAEYFAIYKIQTKETAYMSRVMKKPTFCIYENKDADQLRGKPQS